MAKKGKGGGNGGKEPYWRRIFSTSAPERSDHGKIGFGDDDEEIVFYEYGGELYDTEDEALNSAINAEKTVVTCGDMRNLLLHVGVDRFRFEGERDQDGNLVRPKVLACDFVDREEAKALLTAPKKGDLFAETVEEFVDGAKKRLTSRLKPNENNIKEALWRDLEDELPHNDFWVEAAFEVGLLCPETDRLALECGREGASDAKKEKCKKILSESRFKCGVKTDIGERIIL